MMLMMIIMVMMKMMMMLMMMMMVITMMMIMMMVMIFFSHTHFFQGFYYLSFNILIRDDFKRLFHFSGYGKSRFGYSETGTQPFIISYAQAEK